MELSSGSLQLLLDSSGRIPYFFWGGEVGLRIIPIPSMYGIFTYIYRKNQPNVGKYAIHGSYGIGLSFMNSMDFMKVP